MTDRELLKRAANVAGAELNGYRYGKSGKEPIYGMPIEIDDGFEYRPWNALDDDGDALRLAVKLSLFDEMERKASEIAAQAGYDMDPCEATRRAIVRAAAEMASEES